VGKQLPRACCTPAAIGHQSAVLGHDLGDGIYFPFVFNMLLNQLFFFIQYQATLYRYYDELQCIGKSLVLKHYGFQPVEDGAQVVIDNNEWLCAKLIFGWHFLHKVRKWFQCSVITFAFACTHFHFQQSPNIIKQPMDTDPHECAGHPNRLFQHPIIQEFINIIWSKHARGFASSNPPQVCTQLYTQHDPSIPKQTVALVMSVVSFFFFGLQSATH